MCNPIRTSFYAGSKYCLRSITPITDVQQFAVGIIPKTFASNTLNDIGAPLSFLGIFKRMTCYRSYIRLGNYPNTNMQAARSDCEWL